MQESTLIFVCTHNNSKIIENYNIKPLIVGAEISKLDIYFYKDNSEDNISIKNDDYCELTGQYWVWKNLSTVDKMESLAYNVETSCSHVGFFHYRRYLSLSNIVFLKNIFFFFPSLMVRVLGLNKKNLEKKSQEFDIILPKKSKNTIVDTHPKQVTMKDHFAYYDSEAVVQEVQNIILEIFPNYEEALRISWNEEKSYYKNIFIMKREYFNNYMNFMFSILFEFEKRNENNKISSKKRICGFIAERLLNIYINKLRLDNKNIKIGEFPLLRRNSFNIFSFKYLNKQLIKLKKRFNIKYIIFRPKNKS